MGFTKATFDYLDAGGLTKWITTPKTSAFTAISGEGYLVDTTSAAITVTLPAAPSAGDEIIIVDYASNAGTNNITLGRNSLKIRGGTDDLVLSADDQATRLLYSGATKGWLALDSSASDSTVRITSISYSDSNTATDPAGGETMTITGTNFIPSSTVTVGTTTAPSVTYISATLLRFTTPALSAGDYDLVVEGKDGGVATSVDGISYNGIPLWTTSSGSLASLLRTNTGNVAISVAATEPDGGAITYSLVSGTLPNGFSLNTSTGDITGTMYDPGVTTFNFTIAATDNEGQSTSRAFSISFRDLATEFITTSGTWTVPAGITSVQVQPAAGGGGGGGGGSGGGCGYATGGGGAGGGVGAASSYKGSSGGTGGNYTGGAGGNGGGAVYTSQTTISTTPGASISVTVGAGGAGGIGGYFRGGFANGSNGPRSGSAGGAGGQTSFGNLSTSGTNSTINSTGSAGTGSAPTITATINDQAPAHADYNGRTGGTGASGVVKLVY